MLSFTFVMNTIGSIAALAAAYFWLRSSLVGVPDNMDTFIGALQKSSRLSSYAATSAAIAAAISGALGFIHSLGLL